MSLVGNLEDLGLGEILQIVSLSRKSGVLTLQSRGRHGSVVFRCGQVVRATSSDVSRSPGDVLVERGIIAAETLQTALALQEEEGFQELIGTILVRRFGADDERIVEVVTEGIEQTVYSLFAWQDGSFDFELHDTVDAIDAIQHDTNRFMLVQGLNTQFLAMEAARRLDEQRHADHQEPGGGEHAPDTVDVAFDLMQEPVAAVVEPVPAPAVAVPDRSLAVLVDDDEATREFLAGLLRETITEVVACEGSEDALIAVDTRYRQGDRPLVLIDLIMPRMDGSGILGGLELLELVHNNFPDLRVMVLSDYRNKEAERRVLGLGTEFVLKPRRTDLDDPEVVEEFAARFRELLSRGEPLPAAPGGVNLGNELRMEMGETVAPDAAESAQSTGIVLLRGMLEELNNPALGGGILLLALRFASEFMNRAVIFQVTGGEVVGLGQFGIAADPAVADRKIRALRIPRDQASIFSAMFISPRAVKTGPGDHLLDRHLFAELGGPPQELFLGPIVSGGEVVAIIYGDNFPEAKPIGDTDSLEIFLSQAGMVMEKAQLEKRLKEKRPEAR